MKSFAILAFLLSTQFITFSATSNDEIIEDESYQPQKKKKIYNSYIADELKKNKQVNDFLLADIDDFLDLIPNLSLDLEDSENIKENLVCIMKDARLENNLRKEAALYLWNISAIDAIKICCDLLIDENPMWLEEFLENSFYKPGGTKILVDSAPHDQLLLRTFFLYLTLSKQANHKAYLLYIMSALKTIDPRTSKGVIDTAQKIFATNNFTPKQCFGVILSLDLLGIYATITIPFIELFQKIEKANFRQIIQCTKSIAEGKNLSLDHYTSILDALNQVDSLKYPQIVNNTKILTNNYLFTPQTYYTLIRCGELIDGDLQILWTATCHMCELDVQKRNEILLQIKTMAQTPNWTPSDSFATIKAFYFVVKNQSPNIQNLYNKLGIKKFSTLFRSANMHMQQNPAAINDFLNIFMNIDENHHEDIIHFLNDVFQKKNITTDIEKISIAQLFKDVNPKAFPLIQKAVHFYKNERNWKEYIHYVAKNYPDMSWDISKIGAELLLNSPTLKIEDMKNTLDSLTILMSELGINAFFERFKYANTLIIGNTQVLYDVVNILKHLNKEQYIEIINFLNEHFQKLEFYQHPYNKMYYISCFENIKYNKFKYVRKALTEPMPSDSWARPLNLILQNCEGFKWEEILPTIEFFKYHALLEEDAIKKTLQNLVYLKRKNPSFDFSTLKIFTPKTKSDLAKINAIINKFALIKNTYIENATKIIKTFLEIDFELTLEKNFKIIPNHQPATKLDIINKFLNYILKIDGNKYSYCLEILNMIKLKYQQVVSEPINGVGHYHHHGRRQIRFSDITKAIDLLLPAEKNKKLILSIPSSCNLYFDSYLRIVRNISEKLEDVEMNDDISLFLSKAMANLNLNRNQDQLTILDFLKWILENHYKDREQTWVLSKKYISFMDKLSSEDRELFQALRQKERQKLVFLNNNINYELNDINFTLKETKDFINNFLIKSTSFTTDKKSDDTFIGNLIDHAAWKHSFINMIEDQSDMIDLIDYNWGNPEYKKHILTFMRNRLLKK
ncbi:MAG: hypothetical protein Q8L85_05330 [Alphaproteobacteria bacterium]|nr:hypothetical protein [Alphaproteobacteria bacterium]